LHSRPGPGRERGLRGILRRPLGPPPPRKACREESGMSEGPACSIHYASVERCAEQPGPLRGAAVIRTGAGRVHAVPPLLGGRDADCTGCATGCWERSSQARVPARAPEPNRYPALGLSCCCCTSAICLLCMCARPRQGEPEEVAAVRQAAGPPGRAGSW
jgi:hypothetical protein